MAISSTLELLSLELLDAVLSKVGEGAVLARAEQACRLLRSRIGGVGGGQGEAEAAQRLWGALVRAKWGWLLMSEKAPPLERGGWKQLYVRLLTGSSTRFCVVGGGGENICYPTSAGLAALGIACRCHSPLPPSPPPHDPCAGHLADCVAADRSRLRCFVEDLQAELLGADVSADVLSWPPHQPLGHSPCRCCIFCCARCVPVRSDAVPPARP
jgi:hypothetical protein